MISIYSVSYRAAKDAKQNRKTEHTMGMGLLNIGLFHRYGIGSFQARIVSGSQGKPFLAEYPDIHFNISHCEGYAACALGGCELGVDVERVRPFKEALARRVMRQEEFAALERLKDEDSRQEYFFRVWTLKESYVKALGKGLALPLTAVGFEVGPDGEIASSVPRTFFWQQKLERGLILSVCALTEEPEKCCIHEMPDHYPGDIPNIV